MTLESGGVGHVVGRFRFMCTNPDCYWCHPDMVGTVVGQPHGRLSNEDMDAIRRRLGGAR